MMNSYPRAMLCQSTLLERAQIFFKILKKMVSKFEIRLIWINETFPKRYGRVWYNVGEIGIINIACFCKKGAKLRLKNQIKKN